MRQNVWIWNHYATNMFFDRAGRHYWFAENLIKEGYKPTVFCASTNHFSDNHIDTKGRKYTVDSVNSIPFVFVNTPEYKGNGKKRVLNMISFYRGLFKTAMEYAKSNCKPDVILASSVHPLTLVAGIKIAKKFGIPCICEVRDLWPETLVAYNSLKKDAVLTKILYSIEKWTYKKAHSLIFTMEGAKDYITDKKWNIQNGGPVDLSKVKHINNGINLEDYYYNSEKFKLNDMDLEDDSYKILYTGSLRQTNDSLWVLLATAKLLIEDTNIRILIYGDGTEKEKFIKYCKDNSLSNVYFKGFVEKKYIPYVLSKGDLNILNCSSWSVLDYGGSQNKLFDYLASGKPIISGEKSKYSIISKYKCGISRPISSPEDLYSIIMDFKNLTENQNEEIKANANIAAQNYDYKKLTYKLIQIINKSED